MAMLLIKGKMYHHITNWALYCMLQVDPPSLKEHACFIHSKIRIIIISITANNDHHFNIYYLLLFSHKLHTADWKKKNRTAIFIVILCARHVSCVRPEEPPLQSLDRSSSYMWMLSEQSAQWKANSGADRAEWENCDSLPRSNWLMS